MKRIFYIFIFAIALVVIFVVWRGTKTPAFPRNQDVKTDSSEVSKVDTKNPKNQSQPGDSTRMEKSVAISSNPPSSNQTMQNILMEQNARALDIYGIVTDQYGQPVAGATIEGSILLNVNFVSSGGDTHYTQTDSQGHFKFLGVHGVKMGIRPKKEGYYYDPKLPSSRPDDYVFDLDHPLVFRMWKILRQEALANSNMEFPLPFDGTPTRFDLSTGKQDPTGDMQVMLARSPTQVKRSGQKFDWTLKIEMVRGGLIANDDPYPFWAPEGGYVSSYQLDVSSNDIPWRSTFTQNFYFKNSEGQFGRLRLNAYAGLTPPRVHFDLSSNPTGSQNLEPDLKKQAE